MTIQTDIDLTPHNTLALAATARYFAAVTSLAELQAALEFARQKSLPLCILGGGSNTVFQGDFPGLVVQLALKGIRCEEAGDERLVYAAAGENWDALVRHCLAQSWYGIENLIAIPGSVGAAPIQNIGAYGVELVNVLVSVRGLDLATGQERSLTAAECELGYRDSIFKHALRDNFIITEVCLRLHTDAQPNIHYAALREALPQGQPATPELVCAVVEQTRRQKLPDPALEPNAGSFFKNPIVDEAQAEALLSRYPAMAHWPMPDGRVKLAAAWLVDQCGWKGRRLGKAGVHPRQAIVLVNYERASAEELLTLAAAIQADVHQRFGIDLEIEPRIA